MPMDWTKEFPAAITLCDREGPVLAMNDRSCQMFAKDGGAALIGQSLFPCHPGDSGEKLQRLLQQETPNVYTIEKQGRKKLIYQAPWYERGEYRGYVELSFELPAQIPHFVRD